MRLILFPRSNEDTAVQELPEPDMIVDPRHICYDGNHHTKFKVIVNDKVLTVTRTDSPKDRDQRCGVPTGWRSELRFRVYLRNEFRYSFESSKYLYHGLDYEEAPCDTKEVVIKYGVGTVEGCAFSCCKSLVKVTIPNSVTRIEEYAFYECESLQFIQLPPNLHFIGNDAFSGCISLQAIYLPSTATHIDRWAFEGCTSLRIVNIPDSVENIGGNVMNRCDSLVTAEMVKARTYDEQIQWFRNRYNAFHKLCCRPSPSPKAIRHYIEDHNNNEERSRTNDKPRFTALHLLAANPSVTGRMITVYLQLAPDVAVMQDDIGQTPLHTLCSVPHFSDGAGGAIRAYLRRCEGKKTAFMVDHKNKTPLNYLCSEKSFDDLLFLENKSLSGLIAWWYDCLDINLFMEGANV